MSKITLGLDESLFYHTISTESCKDVLALSLEEKEIVLEEQVMTSPDQAREMAQVLLYAANLLEFGSLAIEIETERLYGGK
jgi:hypothetical protein